jgi:isocitrate/isopropylmalate dehydrogenase
MTSGMPQRMVPATLIPGDGIGPEIVKSAVDILDALGSPFEWDVRQGGLAAIEESHDPLPRATLDSIRRTRLALKGPLTTPVGGGFRSINRTSIDKVLRRDEIRTPDLGGKATTADFTQSIIRRIND